MGVEVEESSEFRIEDALFWHEVEADRTTWFVQEGEDLVARTFSKSGEKIGDDVAFLGVARAYVVRALEDGNYLICYRTPFDVDDEPGYDIWTTSYNLYSPTGQLLSHEEFEREAEAVVSVDYVELSNGNHVEASYAWDPYLGTHRWLTIYDKNGSKVAAEVSIEGDRSIDKVVDLGDGAFAIFSTIAEESSIDYKYNWEHQIQIFDNSGKAIGAATTDLRPKFPPVFGRVSGF